MWAPPPVVPQRSILHGILNFVWLLTIVSFLVILGVATAGTFASIGPVTGGIADIRCGSTVDGTLDTGPGVWSFSALSAIGASGSWYPTGGAPPRTTSSPQCGGLLPTDGPDSGYLAMELDGRTNETTSGYWSQSFDAAGSSPYLARLRFDHRAFQVSPLLSRLNVSVYVESGPGAPVGQPVWTETFMSTGNWRAASEVDLSTGTRAESIDASAAVRFPGSYYLKVAAFAENGPGPASPIPTIIGFDNFVLQWRTNAFVVVYAVTPLTGPLPDLLFFSQDQSLFLAWFIALLVASLASILLLVVRDARPTWRAISAGSEHISAKLRVRSGLVALAQTFAAIAFLNLIIAFLVNPEGPEFLSELPLWYLVFELLNASVYEELVFRVALIGAPLLIAALVFRLAALSARRVPQGTSGARYLAGTFRYLYGGAVDRTKPLRVILPSAILLIGSALVFGYAHAPGWGDWKVVPATLAGLAMGYLYLRHGLHAAILFHFATDMFVGTGYLLGFETPVGLFLNLAYIAIGVLGAGFFAYYLYYSVRLTEGLIRKGAPPRPGMQPAGMPPSSRAAPAAPPATSPLPTGYAPSSRPPAYGGPPVQFRCPRCAWVEAAYENGRFRCLRCGHVV